MSGGCKIIPLKKEKYICSERQGYTYAQKGLKG